MAFQERNKVLRRFGEDESFAAKKYLEYLNEGIGEHFFESGNLQHTEAVEIEVSKKGWPAVIGDHEFVMNAMQKHEIHSHRLHHKDAYKKVMENLATSVSEKYSIAKQELVIRSRRYINTIARQAFCKSAFLEELLPMAVIARFLKITISAVSKLVNKIYLVMSAS